MEPIKNITQKEISETLDNPIDQAGNKIKLRSVSHENLVRHLKNIPYKTMPSPIIKSSKINLSKEVVDWELTPKQYMSLIDGARKPINVKESMIENMRKHSEMVASQERKVTEISNESIVVNQPIQQDTVEVMPELVKKENYSFENVNDLDFNKMREERDNIRQRVKDKKEAIDKEKKEAEEADKIAQEVSVRYTEAQKQNEEEKLKNQEARIKYAETISAQNEILNNIDKKYDTLLAEIKERKEKSLNIVAEMQPKISSIEAENTSLNSDTAKWLELANAASFDNVIDFPYIDEEEHIVKRVA